MILGMEFKFDAAHRLFHYDGLCNQLHGHTWKLKILVEGTITEPDGMVIDFQWLKKIVQVYILNLFDHCTVLNKDDPLAGVIQEVTEHSIAVYTLDGEPTCEHLVKFISERLAGALGKEGIRLVEVELWESETAYARDDGSGEREDWMTKEG